MHRRRTPKTVDVVATPSIALWRITIFAMKKIYIKEETEREREKGREKERGRERERPS